MSKTPILIALTQLRNEGLVYHIKNRGYYIEDVDTEKYKLINDIHEFMEEGYVATKNNSDDANVFISKYTTFSIKHITYKNIKELILNEYAPGQKLIYSDLEKKLCVSKTPINNALSRLESEGYVFLKKNVGYYVRDIKADGFCEVLEARVKLEVANIDFVMMKITDADLVQLEELSKEHSSYITDYYDKKKYQLNANFHLALASIGGNRFMIRYIKNVYGWMSLRGRFSITPSIRMVESGVEHADILKALNRRDTRNVRSLLEKHLRGPIKYMVDELIERKKSSDDTEAE
jgi:DNA-binding GntR family transcriptional regulator